MFLQLQAVRKLIHRYLRRFMGLMTSIDAARLTRKLERRVPLDLKGPATRAIMHQDIPRPPPRRPGDRIGRSTD